MHAVIHSSVNPRIVAIFEKETKHFYVYVHYCQACYFIASFGMRESETKEFLSLAWL